LSLSSINYGGIFARLKPDLALTRAWSKKLLKDDPIALGINKIMMPRVV
jgi:hypothetical protein